MKSVTVQFEAARSQLYSYFVPEGDDPKKGDLVITSLSSIPDTNGHFEAGYSMNMKIGRVVGVEEPESPKATKFYIQLLSREALMARKKANMDFLIRAEQKKAIKAKLDLMLQEQSDTERYERLRSNPEAAELIAKLTEL